MKRTFTASVTQEGDWYVAQALEVDVASQGETEAEALASLREAIELYFEEPAARVLPRIRTIVAEVPAGAAAAPPNGAPAAKGEAAGSGIRKAAGAWKGSHDPDELIRNIYASRREGSRPMSRP